MIGILPRFPRLAIYALSSRYAYKKDARTYGHPILKWAAENGNQYTACKWLGEISATDLGGENDIHEQMTDAAMYGHEAVVQIFLENGASLNMEIHFTGQLYIDIYPWQAHCLRTGQRPGGMTLWCFVKQSI